VGYQRFRFSWLVTGAAAVTTLGLLGPGLPAAAASAGSGTPGGPAVPVLRWHPCSGVPGFQCATAQVPLDYRHPHGPMIQLAVIRHQATDPARRIGSLFFNPGGPGDPGTSYLPFEYPYFPAQVRQRFDIVSWDPRGVGQSTAVQCFPSPAAEAKFFAGLPAGFPVGRAQQDTWIRRYGQFGKICERRQPALLSHVSTAESARDLDLLRRAVGDPKLNYLGVSYGTYLGATYANLFPGKVGAMVLDGNVNPIAWTTPQRAHGIPLSVSLRIQSDLGVAVTLRQFLRLCGQAPVSGCAFSAGTPTATSAKYARLLRDLRARPVTISIPAFGNIPKTPVGTFTYAYVVSVVSQVLFTVGEVPGLAPGWAYGAFVLQTLWTAGRSAGSAREAPAPAPAQADPPPPEQGYAIICADSPNPKNPAVYQAEAAFAQARSGPGGAYITWGDEPCAGWRAADADGYFGPWNRPAAHSILLVGNLFDPATPYQDSLAMARELARARLLTVDGYGHTALDNPSGCVQQYESSYFISGKLPPAGTVCQQNQRPFSVSLRTLDRLPGSSAWPAPPTAARLRCKLGAITRALTPPQP
jgi:pimeloyl-ACP methyl ester carboxylesterase